MSIDWKTDGMADFARTFRRYEQNTSKSSEDAIKHRVSRFGFTLFRLFNTAARKTRATIRRTPAHIMRVRTGDRTQRQEKARRVYAAGFAAAGWLVAALKYRRPGSSARALNPVKDPRGRVTLHLRGPIRTAELVNYAPGAYETDQKHNLSAKALQIETADMNKYLERQAAKNAENFK